MSGGGGLGGADNATQVGVGKVNEEGGGGMISVRGGALVVEGGGETRPIWLPKSAPDWVYKKMHPAMQLAVMLAL